MNANICICVWYNHLRQNQLKKYIQINLDPDDLLLRKDLIDTYTRFYVAVRELETEGDFYFYLNEMNDLLTDDFSWDLPGDMLPSYTSKSEFLDPKTGWHTIGSTDWGVVSWNMGANAEYYVIDNWEIRILFPMRGLIFRENCPYDGALVKMVNEGVDSMGFRWNDNQLKWQIFFYDEHLELHEETYCELKGRDQY